MIATCFARFSWTSSQGIRDSARAGPSGRLFRPANFAFGQFGVGCMMRAVTAFLSLPLACGDDVRLGNLVDVSLVEQAAPA